MLLKYISSVERVLNELKIKNECSKNVFEVLELAKQYFEDAKHFYSRGEFRTGLIAISYCEGLLDALRILGYIEFSWS